MFATIKLEDIGNYIRPKYGEVTGPRVSPNGRAFVAEIVGFNPRDGLKKQELKPMTDYSEANSVGSRGVYKYYFIEPGKFYEVSSPLSWKQTARYFCEVKNGKIIEYKFQEFLKLWLSRNGESFSE